MALTWIAAALVVSSLASVAAAETVVWQAALLSPDGGRQVLADGVETYSPESDVLVQEHLRRRDGAVSWSKSLALDPTFSLSASVRRAPRLRGFGLAIYRRETRNAFSWNWFKRLGGGEFQRRGGRGRVWVTVKKASDYEELAAVEFLDDVPLFHLDDVRRPPGAYSHEVVIRKGSILRFADVEMADALSCNQPPTGAVP